MAKPNAFMGNIDHVMHMPESVEMVYNKEGKREALEVVTIHQVLKTLEIKEEILQEENILEKNPYKAVLVQNLKKNSTRHKLEADRTMANIK